MTSQKSSSLRIDDAQRRIMLPDGRLALQFVKSSAASNRYFLQLCALAMSNARTGENCAAIAELDKIVRREFPDVHLDDRPVATASAYRHLIPKRKSEVFTLPAACSYEIVMVQNDGIPLPFRTNKEKEYAHYLGKYQQILSSDSLDGPDEWIDLLQFCAHRFSDLFTNELQVARNLFSVAGQGSEGKLCVHFAAQAVSGTQVESGHSTVSTRTPPPDRFSEQFFHEFVRDNLDGPRPFIVVWYGSGARGDKQSLDEDYLVLVHEAYQDEASRDLVELGNKPAAARRTVRRPGIDVRLQLFDSFLFNMFIGFPFELSVAFDGKLVMNHGMSREYWVWVQKLRDRVVIDKNLLIDQLKDAEAMFLRHFQSSEDEEYELDPCIAAYHAICCRLQWIALARMQADVDIRMVYWLSKWEVLAEVLDDDNAKVDFKEVVSAFKQDTITSDEAWIENKVDCLFKHATTMENQT